MASSKLSKNKRTETQKKNATLRPTITAQNKAKKLAKHVRRHPNDKQAISGGPNEGTIKLQSMRAKQGVQRLSGLSYETSKETVADSQRPQRFKQVNEEHLGLVRISAATMLKLHEYKNILLGQKQTLAEANQEFSTDPLK